VLVLVLVRRLEQVGKGLEEEHFLPLLGLRKRGHLPEIRM
jgi:hypothetical protein